MWQCVGRDGSGRAGGMLVAGGLGRCSSVGGKRVYVKANMWLAVVIDEEEEWVRATEAKEGEGR